jgi:predicted kinase
MARIERGYVIVSGAPGAGKSTLAGPLSAQLGLPLFAKDPLKETLYDRIPAAGAPAAWSKVLGGAAMELIWRLASLAPAAVLEADFRPSSDYERARIAALPGPTVEVYCRCPPDLAAQRYARRHTTRHPTHVRAEVTLEQLAEFDRPVALGPVVEVDTTRPVDVPAVAQAVIAAFASKSPPPTGQEKTLPLARRDLEWRL